MNNYRDIHCHTYGSVTDSNLSPKRLVLEEAKLGRDSVALTDHGVMYSMWEFMEACSSKEVTEILGKPMNGVPGIEFYVKGSVEGTEDSDDIDVIGIREHLIVLPKNNDGLYAVSKCCTESMYNIVGSKPLVTKEMLKKWFGPGSKGHGNVFATSACMIGVINSKLLANNNIDTQIKKLKEQKEKKGVPKDKDLENKFLSLQKTLEELGEEKKAATALAGKPFKMALKKAEKSGDQEQIEAIKREIEESEKAKVRVEEILREIAKKKAEFAPVKEAYEKAKTKWDKYESLEKEIKTLSKNRISKKVARENAVQELNEYIEIFGKDNFYVEVQYHGIPAEKECMPVVAEIARENGIKIIAANDVHIATPDDAEARALLFSQKYYWKEASESDRQLCIKTDEEIYKWLSKILPDDIVKEAMENTKILLDQCHVTLSTESHYPKFTCPEGTTVRMLNKVAQGKKKVKKWTSEYDQRLAYELRVIKSMGFFDYLLIVEDFLNYGRLLGKIDLNSEEFLADPFNLENLTLLAKNGVGEGVGPGRGSAVGSLVCYLLGITNLDPIENNLLFERFLNPERVTMPDIDSDFSVEVRGWVIEYCKHRYGEKAVCQIMTQGFFAGKSSIRAAARTLINERELTREKDPAEYNRIMNLADKMSSVFEFEETLNDAYVKLIPICESEKDAQTLFDRAMLMENSMNSVGKHAAGVIISDNDDISDYVPLTNVKGFMASQCDKDRTEAIGLLKMDFLGLRNLSIITDCEREIYRTTGKKISIDNLPFEKEVFEKIFQTGNTNNVFQFESEGMKRVLTELKPESFSDLVLLVALYRPGPAQYIDIITKVKNGTEKAQYLIPEMEEVLGSTYGKPVYQEQIQQIFNKFAGFSLGKADIIRRHMAKKHYDEFAAYKEEFVNGMIKRGASKEATEAFWNELLDFASYAFNRSHAAAYAYVAYATAYLKYHYPAEYTVGCLNYPTDDGQEDTLQNSINNGIKILCPDVNRSKEKFIVYGDSVLFGLERVARLNTFARDIVSERETNGNFTDVYDFVLRTNIRKDVMINLINAGGFDSFNKNRQQLLDWFEVSQPVIKKIREKKKKEQEETDPAKKEKLSVSIRELEDQLTQEREPVYYDVLEGLLKEKEVIGYFISGFPLDTVKEIPEGTTEIAKISTAPCKLFGFVSSFEKIRTKKNEEMAKICIADNTGVQNCTVFPKNMSKCDCKEHAFVIVSGRKFGDTFAVDSVEEYIPRDFDFVLIDVPCEDVWNEKRELIDPYFDLNGYPLKVRFVDTGNIIETDEFVSKDIENAALF